MGKSFEVKVLGKARAMVLRSKPGKLGVKYDTTIYSNNADNPFIKKLVKIGFHIISFNTKYLRVMLPVGWSHLRISKDTEVIIDEKSRVRLGIERKLKVSVLYRRYDFTIQLASTGEGDDKKYSVMTQLTDAGTVTEEFSYDYNTLQSVDISLYAKNDDDIVESFKLVMAEVLNNRYPEWNDELAYWED
jgi:hypothetical protein